MTVSFYIEPCAPEGLIKLVTGSDIYEGRVEICATGGAWSTVCDDFWGSADAKVVCRQLGYATDGKNKTVQVILKAFLLR